MTIGRVSCGIHAQPSRMKRSDARGRASSWDGGDACAAGLLLCTLRRCAAVPRPRRRSLATLRVSGVRAHSLRQPHDRRGLRLRMEGPPDSHVPARHQPPARILDLPIGVSRVRGERRRRSLPRSKEEEARADVRIRDLLCVIDVPQISQVHLVYRAHLLSARTAPTRESDEVVLMAEHEIPWGQLAFSSIETSLRRYFDDRARRSNGRAPRRPSIGPGRKVLSRVVSPIDSPHYLPVRPLRGRCRLPVLLGSVGQPQSVA